MLKRIVVEHGFARKSEFQAEDVELIGGSIIIHNDGELVAAFREWDNVMAQPIFTDQMLFAFMEEDEDVDN